MGNQHEITYGVIIPYINSNYTKEELRFFCSKNGIKFEAFELKYRFRDPRLIWSFFAIIQAIRKAKPDIIYFADFNQPYLNVLLLLVDRSKTIIALHDVEGHSKTTFSFIARLSKKILISNFNYFQTFSSIQQNLLKYQVPKKSIFNISLPMIDFGPINFIPAKQNVTRFLFFGFILYYKGLDLLLKAFRRVSENYPGIELTIAGRCKDWDENYEALVNGSHQIKKYIRFIGNDEIANFFAQTDYVVLPYRDTTQSGPLMIAYNYNIPVLVSKSQGFNEFTSEDVTGYSFDLFIDNDMEHVLEACVERSSCDYDKLKKRLARYTEKNFSMKTIILKYERMFQTIQSLR
jgi:glycosyltransferase involved in cell wall biosynthesis